MNLAQKKIYGLIGYPVKHSLSPLMHNAAFRTLGIPAEYRLFSLPPDELRNFLKNFEKNNISGLNVTVPYKEKVIPFLDKLSKEARLIGAVNTIKVSENKLQGFNTDGEGFLKHLTCDLKFNPKGRAIALIGAGGAARGILVYLSRENPKRISLYDIDKAKAQALLKHLRENFKNVDFSSVNSVAELNINDADLLINATPIGMKHADPCLVDEKYIHKNLLVYDLIYNPKETKLLRVAGKIGAKVSNGLGMLLYQGALSFEIWTGKIAPIEIMRSALNEGVKKLCLPKL
jgi:shikimate dehydrogenase